MPRRQVSISSTSTAPNSTGTQAPSNSFSRLAARNVVSTTMNGTISSAAGHEPPLPQLPDHDERQQPVDHHGGRRPRCRRRRRARSTMRNMQHQQQHADQQQRVDARDVDLPVLRRRGVADLEARQQAELDRLLGERIGAGDHRLAGDHGRGGREHDHRQQQRLRNQLVERILDRLRMREHQRALPEIVDASAPASTRPNHAVWIGLRPKWPRSA